MSTPITTADRDRLLLELPPLAAKLQYLAAELGENLKKSLETANKIGEVLEKAHGVCVKAKVPWGEWVERHTPFTRQHVARMRLIHKHWAKIEKAGKAKVNTINRALDFIAGRVVKPKKKGPPLQSGMGGGGRGVIVTGESVTWRRVKAAAMQAGLEADAERLEAFLKALGVTIAAEAA